jgi:hypothetical protein
MKGYIIMSLGVVIKGPEGVVLAADSRVTVTAQRVDGPQLSINFDNATKLLSLLPSPHNYVGVVTYGAAVIGLRTAHSFMPEFEVELPENRLTIEDYANRLSDFFVRQWEENAGNQAEFPPMTFIVGGYDEKSAYGKVFLFSIPIEPEPVEQNPGDDNFGMTWGGQLQIATRLIHGYDPELISILRDQLELDEDQLDSLFEVIRQHLEFSIPYRILPLQDCVDLATLMVRTTIKAQDLAIGVRGVGGPIDVAAITRTDGLQYIQQKTLKVE